MNLKIIEDAFQKSDEFNSCRDHFHQAAYNSLIEEIHPLTGVAVMMEACYRMVSHYNKRVHLGNAKYFLSDMIDYIETNFKEFEIPEEEMNKQIDNVRLLRALKKLCDAN
jgi:hypothetical protein